MPRLRQVNPNLSPGDSQSLADKKDDYCTDINLTQN